MAVTTPTVAPLSLKDLDLIFGEFDGAGAAVFTDAVNYKKHVDQVEFAPSTSTQTWTGGDGSTYTDVAPATWDCTIRYAQDWDTEGSLSVYLFDNEGTKVPVKFQPRAGHGSTFTATLVITPGSVGGQLNTLGTPTSAKLGCSGKPVRIPAA